MAGIMDTASKQILQIGTQSSVQGLLSSRGRKAKAGAKKITTQVITESTTGVILFGAHAEAGNKGKMILNDVAKPIPSLALKS